MDYWDRRLLKSQLELEGVRKALKDADGDREKLRKNLKKTKRFYKSRLGEVARLDHSLYNVGEQTQESSNGDEGPETTGDVPTN
jgi:hypothetical protein